MNLTGGYSCCERQYKTSHLDLAALWGLTILDNPNPVKSKTIVCEYVSISQHLNISTSEHLNIVVKHTPVSTGGATISRTDSMQ